nr:immunoglobulin heavy chain junction region [Macaca mulatta]MOY21307.1 immunoglobulin heavy chain junction region [Macaca mulatta]MOY21456.1 immunoglobulin heavy chain junction region [Macaca mulatta]MOY22348.1 immunoglobulin heavy chain junction region [Macaca mulatta]MOY23000.1 immunoglobulin heavy chain junction region [Macaca mulatta]
CHSLDFEDDYGSDAFDFW